MIGTLPTLRLGLSFASLWGVISFSISGFSFPVMAMNFAGLEQPVSVTSLFPDLCRSGAQRIQHGLLMVQLYGIINIHDASLLCGSPLERSIGLL
jgi:hypothetical protein